MESTFCSFSPVQQDHDFLIENTIFSPTFPGWSPIPHDGNTFDHISSINCSNNLEDNIHEKEKKLQITTKNEKPSAKDCVKKISHRDIERQRRQEMSTLYASLRSVLPAQQLKGKRSISDQLHEAAKYIKYLQKNTRDLGVKRDQLKKSTLQNESTSPKVSPIIVTVQSCGVGVEVLITAEESVNNVPLSRVLRMLLGVGLLVVCFNSTSIDGSLNYMIQSEVDNIDRSGIDLHTLQSKISEIINSYRYQA